jgi:hypothetical protein
LFSEFDDGQMSEVEELMDLTIVHCALSKSDSGVLGCDEVAKIYSAAVPEPPERFLVQVTPQGSSQAPCQVVYSADGTPIAPLDDYDPDALTEAEP